MNFTFQDGGRLDDFWVTVGGDEMSELPATGITRVSDDIGFQEYVRIDVIFDGSGWVVADGQEGAGTPVTLRILEHEEGIDAIAQEEDYSGIEGTTVSEIIEKWKGKG